MKNISKFSMKLSFDRRNNTVVETLRHASCTKGWLKTFNQIILSLTTILVFSLLLYMVVVENWETETRPNAHTRCNVMACGIVCENIGLDAESSAIYHAVEELMPQCLDFGTSLVLNNIRFYNNSIDAFWLQGIGVSLTVLSIFGGNLKHIKNYAFFSTTFKNLQIFTLSGIELSSLESEQFLGLDGILEFSIVESEVHEIKSRPLNGIEDTLITLKIQRCFNWNPINITGTQILYSVQVVDFTLNAFGDILTKDTFSGLHNVTLLYLSSSHISSIELGAFDHLYNINRLTLNDNNLMTLHGGIFSHITTLFPSNALKIDLHGNPWHCDCELDFLRKLVVDQYTLLDLTCITPPTYFGQLMSTSVPFCNDSTEILPSENSTRFNPLLTQTLELTQEINYENECSNNTDLVTVDCNNGLKREFNLHNITSLINSALNKSVEISLAFYNFNTLTLYLHEAWKNLSEYDLIWFQGVCYEEQVCITSVSNIVQVPNMDIKTTSTYCLVHKSSIILDYDFCVRFELGTILGNQPWWSVKRTVTIFLFILTILVSITIGAVAVCVAIRKNPVLLKGSKRVILVKHNTTNAVILPKKFREPAVLCDKIPEVPSRLHVRSESSMSTPSYVSAVQPTDEQLAVWRLTHEMNYSVSVEDINVADYVNFTPLVKLDNVV